jgi:hypothetical protein
MTRNPEFGRAENPIAGAKSPSRAVAVRCAMGCYRQLWVNASQPGMTCFLERH